MTLTIELTPTEEAQLTEAARQEGMAPALLAKQVLTQHLRPKRSTEDPMLALFAQWESEDSAMTTEEIAEENRTWVEFKANINAERDRTGARRVF